MIQSVDRYPPRSRFHQHFRIIIPIRKKSMERQSNRRPFAAILASQTATIFCFSESRIAAPADR